MAGDYKRVKDTEKKAKERKQPMMTRKSIDKIDRTGDILIIENKGKREGEICLMKKVEMGNINNHFFITQLFQEVLFFICIGYFLSHTHTHTHIYIFHTMINCKSKKLIGLYDLHTHTYI